MQATHLIATGGGTVTCHRASVGATLIGLARTEGRAGLFKGLTAPLASLTFANAISFGTSDGVRRRILRAYPNTSEPLSYTAGGAAAGAVLLPLITAMEAVKVRAQVDNAFSTPRHGSAFHVLKHMINRWGVRSLYVALPVMVPREIGFAIFYFGTFGSFRGAATDTVDRMLPEGTTSTIVRAALVPICGGIAGALSWSVVYPLDSIKTNVQTQKSLAPGQFRSCLNMTRAMYRGGGFGIFYRGLSTCVARAFVVSSTRFSTFELAMALLQRSS